MFSSELDRSDAVSVWGSHANSKLYARFAPADQGFSDQTIYQSKLYGFDGNRLTMTYVQSAGVHPPVYAESGSNMTVTADFSIVNVGQIEAAVTASSTLVYVLKNDPNPTDLSSSFTKCSFTGGWGKRPVRATVRLTPFGSPTWDAVYRLNNPGVFGNQVQLVLSDNVSHTVITVVETSSVKTINFDSDIHGTQDIDDAVTANAKTFSVLQRSSGNFTPSAGSAYFNGGIGANDASGALVGDVAQETDDGVTLANLPNWCDPVRSHRICAYAVDKSLSLSAANGFSSSAVGTGAAAFQIVNDDTKGHYQTCTTGTTSTGSAIRVGGTSGAVNVALSASSHQWRYEVVFRIPVVSDGTNTFQAYAGFGDTTTTEPSNGAYFKIDATINTNILCVTANGGTRTTTDSGFALVANTWYRGIIVITNNGTVDFTLVAETSSVPSTPTVTNTTNIFSSSSVILGVIKSLGTTARTMDFSYQMVSHNRLAA